MYYVIEQQHEYRGAFVDWVDGATCPIRGQSADAPGIERKATLAGNSQEDVLACGYLPHCPLISTVFKAQLDTLKIPTLECMPVELEDRAGQQMDGFWYLNPLVCPEAIDRDASDLALRGSKIRRVHSFRLCEKKLNAVPEDERMLFRPGDYKGLMLVNESVADMIRGFDPKGLQLLPVDAWSIDLPFLES